MQPFIIVDRKTKRPVNHESYMANSRDHALEIYFAQIGRRDETVKAKGPDENPKSLARGA